MNPVNKISYRSVVRYLGQGAWASCDFEELKEGETFKLFERGQLIGCFTARSAPYPEAPSGNWGILTEPWNPPA